MTRYCPHGDGAFDDWVASCPECGSSLIDTPPDLDDLELETEQSRPVLLTSAPNEIEANLVAGILRDEGIPVMLRPGGPGFGAWASVMSFEHGIYVREIDRRRAQSILDETVVEDEPAPEES